jgi:hypothetical protein
MAIVDSTFGRFLLPPFKENVLTSKCLILFDQRLDYEEENNM